jgi:cytochrome P450
MEHGSSAIHEEGYAVQVPVSDEATLEQLEADPYPVYRRLRRDNPISRIKSLDRVVATTWDPCMEVYRREEDFGPAPHLDPFFGVPNILSMTGPEHLSLREGVDARLRPRVTNVYLDDLVRPICRRYVERIKDRGACDLTTDLLEPISVRAVGDIMGMSDVDDDTLRRWFHGLARGMVDSAEFAEQTAAAKADLDDYMRARLADLARNPEENMLSHMVHGGRPEGQPRTFDDLIGSIRVIILGGLQEPGHGAANAVMGVLQDPEQTRQIVAEPHKLAGPAVHEGLRWMAPIQLLAKVTLRETTLCGFDLVPGDVVTLSLASANRDEQRYEDPDRFDLHRPRQQHLAFGFGSHVCSGHFLSRQLDQIALEELFTQLPAIRLDPDKEPTVWGFTFRGALNLPVVWN